MEGGKEREKEGDPPTLSAPPAVISKHGKDCEALSLALEGKTIAQCRNFFTNYKRKLNLPRFIAEYEIKNVSLDHTLFSQIISLRTEFLTLSLCNS